MFTSIHSQENGKAILANPTIPSQEIFLYIGKTPFYNNSFSSFFNNCILISNYSEVKKELLITESIPALIIIDIPLNHFELVSFKVWLRSNQLQNIPIIYNQASLNQIEIKQIFSQKLVDDVVDLEKHFQKLPDKTKFIQKIKNTNSISSVKVRNNNNAGCKLCVGKKILDTVLTAAIIVVCLPIFLFIAIAIKFESKGPVLYCSNRAGKGFKIFKFYKFRTMIIDADKHIKELENLNQYTNNGQLPAFFKIQDDPRVTKVGAFLRKTSLDELPQLLNVLKGDMSLVGNRPLPLYEASTLTTDEWAERFMAPAGITGLWQVSKRGKENMSNEERILLDIVYARTRTLKGDLKIMFQTPGALIQKSNV
jgi:lipopolysaccharide/colanic/teichoic acid biosynthesis glycosyltransferase